MGVLGLTKTTTTHAAVKVKHMLCFSICATYVLTTLASVITNTNSKHLGVKYPCTECDYQATQQASLKTHFNSKHAGVTYPCDQCEYKANTQKPPIEKIHISYSKS